MLGKGRLAVEVLCGISIKVEADDAAKAKAALDGRTSVLIDDLRAVAAPVLRHRLVTTYAAQAEGQTSDTIVAALLKDIPVRAGADRIDGQVAQVFRS